MSLTKYQYLMREALNANRLFRAPGAFKFTPKWSLHAKRAARHKIVRREARVSRKLFAKKSAFRFRPKWRAKSRVASRKGLLAKRYGRGKGRGASMLKVRKADKEWVKFAKRHGLKV